MKTEKSFSSMLFVIIVSIILIAISLFVLLKFKDGSAIVLAVSSILFLTPVLIYSIILYKLNYKKKDIYKKEAAEMNDIVSANHPPSLSENRKHKGKKDGSFEKTEIFIEAYSK